MGDEVDEKQRSVGAERPNLSVPEAIAPVRIPLFVAVMVGVLVITQSVANIGATEKYFSATWFGRLGGLAISLGMFGFLGWQWWRRRRLLRVALEAKLVACTKCVHSLEGLGEEGVCPECGTAFKKAEAFERWRRVAPPGFQRELEGRGE